MSLTPQPLPQANAKTNPIRVMIVDDSAVVRGLLSRWVEAETDLVVIGTASDGEQALRRVTELKPDLVILDIEMPNMSGLEALPKMIAAVPGLKILMASTLTTRGASVTLRALELGAADYVPKPETSRLGGAQEFSVELVNKIRAICRRRNPMPVPPLRPMPGLAIPNTTVATPEVAKPRIFSLRSKTPVEVLFVGASTGGPPALRQFLTALGPDWKMPIVITQHMPAAFTAILADNLDKAIPMTVREAKDGDTIQAGHVYIAPGDYHLTVREIDGRPFLKLDQNPPVNFCRPAVDPLFKSAAEVYGARALGMVLTGMGHDGRDGAAALKAKGAKIMVQDEATSVVWGMPGAIAEAGLADLIKPINTLSEACRAFARGTAYDC